MAPVEQRMAVAEAAARRTGVAVAELAGVPKASAVAIAAVRTVEQTAVIEDAAENTAGLEVACTEVVGRTADAASADGMAAVALNAFQHHPRDQAQHQQESAAACRSSHFSALYHVSAVDCW